MITQDIVRKDKTITRFIQKNKRLLSFILIILLCINSFSFLALAEEGLPQDVGPPVVSIMSSNENHSAAKVGDTVTVSITSGEDLEASLVINIAGENAAVSGSGGNWTGTYMMTAEDEEGQVSFSVDIPGDPVTTINATTDGSWVKFYKTKPVIIPDSIETTIQVNSDYTDTTTAEDSHGEDLTALIEKSITLDGNAVDDVDTATVGTYIVTYNVKDAAGNEADTVIKTVNVQPEDTSNSAPSKSDSFLSPAPGQSFNGGEDIAVSWESSTDQEGDSVSYVLEFSPDGTDWEAIYSGSDTTYTYNDTAGVNSTEAQFRVKAKDAEGLESEYTFSGAFAINTFLLELNEVTISSDNDNHSAAKVGNRITLRITSSEVLTLSPVIRIGGKDAAVEGSEKSWTGSYVMTGEDTVDEDGTVSFSIDIPDEPGMTVSATTDDSCVKFYKTKPVITLDFSEMTIPVNNVYTDGTTARDSLGEDLTAQIVRSGEVNTVLAGTYTVTYNVSDAAGNEAVEVTKTVSVYPVASNSTKSGIVENKPVGFSAEEFVLTGDTLDSIKITALPDNGKLMLGETVVNEDGFIEASALNTLSYVADDGFSGNDSFKWTGTGLKSIESNEATMTLSIRENGPPSKPDSFIEPLSGQIYSGGGSITASWQASNDPEGETVTYILEFTSDGSNWEVIHSGTDAFFIHDAPQDLNTESAQFRVKAKDTENHESEYTASGIFTIDSTAPDLNSVSIRSNNTNDDSLAKAGEEITVSITSNEDLASKPVITIAGNEAVVSGDKTSWTGVYRMTVSDAEGIVSITVDYKDIGGNSGAQKTGTTDGSAVIFDRTRPVIFLNDDPEITIPVDSEYVDKTTANDNIDGVLTESMVKSGDQVNTHAVGTYSVTYNVSDAAGNQAVPVTKTVHVQPIASNSTKSGIVGNIPKGFSVDEFTLTGDTATSIKITRLPLTGELKLNGVEVIENQVIQISELDKLNYRADNSFDGDDTTKTDSFNWAAIGEGQIYSNEATMNLEIAKNVLPTNPGNITGVADGQRFKEGEIELSWGASTDTDGDEAAITYTLEFFNDTDWAVVYTGSLTSFRFNVSGDINCDNARFRVKATDQGSIESEYTESAVFIIDNEVPYLGSVKIMSSSDTSFAKSGETITVEFTSSEGLSGTPEVTIAGHDAEVSGSGSTWSAVYTMTDEDTEGIVQFSIIFVDLTGIPGVQVTTTSDSSQIVFDRTKPVITLNGSSVVTVEAKTSYTDAGVEVLDNLDSEIEGRLVITGEVTIGTVGNYTIKYNVTDGAGNVADEITRTVHVVDTTIPVIELKGSPEITIEVHSIYTDAGATAADNYDGDLTGEILVDNPVVMSTVGTYTITYDVTDSNGNKAVQVTRIVNVVDTTIPVITITGETDLTIEVGSTYEDAGATATDNYDSDVDITGNIVRSGSVNSAVVGDYTINYNVTDSNGNKAEQKTRTVHVVDTQKPVITINGEEEITLEVHTPYDDAGATATDNYDGNLTGKIVVNNPVKANVVGAYTVTYDVKDSSGNSADTVSRTVIVEDKTPPIITLKGVRQDGNSDVTIQVHSNYSDATAIASATATDNYDGDLSSEITVDNPVNIHVVGTYEVTFNVTDTNGNTATPVKRKVHVVDTQKPVITLNAESSITIPLGTEYTDAGATVTDNYDDTKTITGTGTVNINTVGTYTIRFNAADTSGNTASQVTRTVRVADLTPPVITLTNGGEGTTDYTMEVHDSYHEPGYTVTDNYDAAIQSKVVVSNPIIVDAVGVYTVTYNVTDAGGNKAEEVTRKVHVVDRTKPIITLKGNNIATGLPDVWVEVKTPYDEPGYTATDNYDGDLTDDVIVSSNVDVNVLGNYTITYNVTDESENTATQVTRTVHVVDTIEPVLTLIGSSVVSVPKDGTYEDEGVTATDNYETLAYLNEHLKISVNGVLVADKPVTLTTPGTYVLIYSVSDSSDNAAKSVRRTVYVHGDGGPGPNITVNPVEDTAEVKTGYNIMAGVTARDRDSVDITDLITVSVKDPDGADVTGSISSGSINFQLVGDYIITYRVTEPVYDGSDSEIRIVHVVDTTPPVLTLNGGPVVEVEVHTSYTDAGAEAEDNYDDSAILSSKISVKNSVVINKVGEYEVTYNVTDANGNAAVQISRTVKVVDTIPPVITLLGLSEITLEAKTGTYSEPGAIATDNYDGDLSNAIIKSGSPDINTVGDYVLTYSVTDANGNTDEKQRTIKIRDTKGPVITLVKPQGSDSSTVTIEVHTDYMELGATAVDGYDGSIIDVTINASGLNKDVLGSYTVSYTATDARGNKSTAGRTVRVVDTTPPDIKLNGSASITLEVHTNYEDAGATATDNYDENVTVLNNNIFVVNPVISNKVGVYEVTYTLSDSNGNTANAIRTVNIVDTTKPVITVNGSPELTIPLNSVYSDVGAIASDNYDGDITGSITSIGTVDTSSVGRYEITYDVSDAHNNAAVSKKRTVFVQPIASVVSKPGVQNVQMRFTFDEFSSKFTGDELSQVKIVTLPSNGTLKNNGADVNAGDTLDSLTIDNLVYIPNNNRVGKDSFNWTGVGAKEIWSNNAGVNFDIIPNIPPATPGSFTGFTAGQAFKGGSSINIGWGPSTDPDGNLGYLINYVLEFYNGTSWSELGVVTDTSYTYDLPELNITSARFRVKARDAGNNDSAYQVSPAFTIDSKSPSLTVVSITSNNNNPGYAKAGEGITVVFTASEALSTKPVVTIAGHEANVTGSGASWSGKYTLTIDDEERIVPFTINFSDLVGNVGAQAENTSDSSKVIFDKTKPVIELSGESTVTISVADTYTDTGATATDTQDENISSRITTTSTVTNSVGTYTVTYNVKDNAGNSGDPVIRTVIVQPKASNGTKNGVENITVVFALNDFTSRYTNDTLASIRITSLPANGTLKLNGTAVGIGEDILRADISKLTYVPNTGFHNIDSFKWTAVGDKEIRSTEAVMSLDIKANSPPTTPGPITGVSAGQKVKGGSTVSLAWGASEDPDNGGLPLQYIFEFSENGSTWTEIYSGTALSYTYSIPTADVATARFRVKAKDAGGFESGYRNSAVYTIDSTPPVLTIVGITSSNSNTGLAKTADVITVGFEANEDLSSLPEVIIAGNNASVTGSGKSWTAKYTMRNTDAEGPVQFSIDFKDVAGNNGVKVTNTLDSSEVIFDRTNPTISLIGPLRVTTPFGIPYDDAGATASDSREGDISGSITSVSTVDTENVGHYKITYNVKDGAGNSAAPVVRDVDVQPRADDGTVTALENVTYGFSNVDFQSCYKGDSVNGIRITAVPLHGTLKDGDSVVKNGDNISSITNLIYIPHTGYHGNDSFKWNGMGTKGIGSTEATMTIVIDENLPPSVPGAFEGSILAPGAAIKGGTTITVQFGASTNPEGDREEPVEYVLEFSSDGESWTEIYIGTGTSFDHTLELINTDEAQYRVKARDEGNFVSDYIYSGIFTIDSRTPMLTPVSITSNNNAHGVAKCGDKITLSFTANEDLKEVPVVKIAGQAAEVEGSGTNWTAEYTMKDTDGEGQIPFSIEFEDLLGNKGATVTGTTDGSKVIYDRTKPVITITGADETIEVYSTYVDKGAAAADNYDTGVTGKIITDGTVNTDVLGDYQITYNVSDAAGNIADQKIRTVRVKDMTKPVITLKGLPEASIAVGSVYSDLGAAATDNYDSSADITKNIVVINSVDVDVIGDYTVTYGVEDSNGNKADRVTRIVHVIDDIVQLYGQITEQDSGNAISGADVLLYDLGNVLRHAAAADINGNYVFDDVVLGQYKLVVEKEGYSTKSMGIKLAAEDVASSKIRKDVQLVDFVITLTANPSSIIGDGVQRATFDALITDKDNNPIPGITVTFSAEMGTFPEGITASTGLDGKCSVAYMSEKLEGIDSKRITVRAEVDDDVNNLHASNEIVITYEPSVVKGVVVDNDTGENVKGAIVEVSKDFNGDGIVDFYARFVTADDGKYVIAVPRGNENYEIKITKPVLVNGAVKDMTFSQTCSVVDAGGTGSENNSANTIAGLLLYKEPDGSTVQLNDYSKYEIKVTEKQNGAGEIPATIDNGNEKGVFQAAGLQNGKTYIVAVTYELEDGSKIKVGDAEVTVSSDGQIGISTILIDPYGTITDGATGDVIIGARVTLYYARTARNIAAGKTPDGKVDLPKIIGFEPNDNENPQNSDPSGQYAFMVFPNTDYYITAAKEGYMDYRSPTIPVEEEIVQWNFTMNRPSGAGVSVTVPIPMEETAGVKRIAGDTRIDTAIEIARAAFKGRVKNVVLARSDIFADALSGSVLSYKYDAPILLVGKTESDLQKVLTYMKDALDVDGNVFILGEYGAVSTYVEQRMRENFSSVIRIGGADRYETSAKIAEYLKVSQGTNVIIASGEDFPDALSVSSAAAVKQYPILLVQKDRVPEAIEKKLMDIKPEKTFVIGLQGAISESVEDKIRDLIAYSRPDLVRIGGKDRYETSIETARYFDTEGTSLGITTGDNFPDALASSIYGARFNTSIILVDKKLTGSSVQYINDKKLTEIVIFGGPGAVDQDLEQQLKQMIIDR